MITAVSGLPRSGTSMMMQMLEAFLELGDEGVSDEEIAKFASRWGVLEICSHGYPVSHNPGPFPDRKGLTYTGCKPMDFSGDIAHGRLSGSEPTRAWRVYSRRAMATFKLAKMIRTQGTAHGDFLHHASDIAEPFTKSINRSAGFRAEGVSSDLWQDLLAQVLNNWMVLGGATLLVARLPFRRRHASPTVRLGGDSFFGALAAQLVTACAGLEGLAICSGCNRIYAPERRPAAGRQNYCRTCRKDGTAHRLSMASTRAKQRDSKKRRKVDE